MAGKRASARFCSEACRKRAKRGGVVVPVPMVSSSGLVDATRVELVAGGQASSALGVAALALAAQIDAAPRADLVREFRATLAAALADGGQAVSPLDELKARRDAKRGA